MTTSLTGQPFFCSWSGGKDSCLALYHAIRLGGKPQCLLTMLDETGGKSRSHGLSRELIEQQADRIGLPVVFRSATWDGYEQEFLAALRDMKTNNIHDGVFGDIDVEAHLTWVRRVCAAENVVPHHPLWHQERRQLLDEFIRLDFKATIVVVNENQLDGAFVGREIDRQTVADLTAAGVDPSGELGEYHTVVTGGPIFRSELRLREKRRISNDGYRFLELEAAAG